MDIIIKSQANEQGIISIVKAQNITLYFTDILATQVGEIEPIKVGRYSVEERAKEVFEDIFEKIKCSNCFQFNIQDKITKISTMDLIYEMPKE